MSTHQLAILTQAARREERKNFRRHATLNLGKDKVSSVKTVDISLSGLSIMVEAPLSIGQTASITLNVTIDTKPISLQLNGKVCYCILVGTEGFRVGLSIGGDETHKKHIEKIMNTLAF